MARDVSQQRYALEVNFSPVVDTLAINQKIGTVNFHMRFQFAGKIVNGKRQKHFNVSIFLSNNSSSTLAFDLTKVFLPCFSSPTASGQ